MEESALRFAAVRGREAEEALTNPTVPVSTSRTDAVTSDDF